MSGVHLLVAAAWAGGPFHLDLSALDPEVSDYPVSRVGAGLCGPAGAPDGTVLAAAIVTYGRRPGRSAWGHTSLRFMACEDGLLRDVEYEYYRMGPSIERWFRAQHTGEHWTEDVPYLKGLHGALVLVRNERPADGGFYAVELAKNREIIEAWMPWPGPLRQRLYADLEGRYAHQLSLLRSGAALDGYAYAPMGTNCTLHVREALAAEQGRAGQWSGSVFPMRNLRDLEARSDIYFVLHPSPHVLRALRGAEDLPVTVDSVPHGIVRRRLPQRDREDVERVLPDASPAVVEWLLTVRRLEGQGA